MEKESNFVSAVLYLHNAEETARGFLECVCGVLARHFLKYEVVCVNDASDARTAAEVREFAAEHPGAPVTILHMSYFQGRELAMNAGMDLAIGDFVFEFDVPECDFDPELIFGVYQRALEGYDIVGAHAEGRTRASSGLFYAVYNRFSGSPYKLTTESFRVLSRRAINRVHSMTKTIPFRKAVYANCGLKLDSLPYRPTRECAKDRQDNAFRRGLAVDSLMLFTDIAYKFAFGMTLLMILATVFVAVYAIAVFLTGAPVEGWTTTMLFLAFCFFGVFAVLTIVLKYMTLLIDLTFKKAKYTFESIEKLSR